MQSNIKYNGNQTVSQSWLEALLGFFLDTTKLTLSITSMLTQPSTGNCILVFSCVPTNQQ